MKVNEPQRNLKQFRDMMNMIFSTQEEDITCDECYEDIDIYVDKLREGEDPTQVLPQVQRHLEQCACCHGEFRALITLLEAEREED